MSRIAHAISEITNVAPDTHQPYVGMSAFAHKAGLHASAVKVDPMLYQHVDPALTGNDMRMLVSDMAGRASVELKGRELGYDLSGDRGLTGAVVDRVKALEALGRLYPELAALELIDYKVRILEGSHGTGAVTRVLIESGDGQASWGTVGVHENVIAASWHALEEAVAYCLLRAGYEPSVAAGGSARNLSRTAAAS